MAIATIKSPRSNDRAALQAIQPGQPTEYDMCKVLRMKFPPVPWIVKDLIPADFNMISASPKAGKSLFAFMCALKVGMADPEPGKAWEDGPSVLYISPDDTDLASLAERGNMLLGGKPEHDPRVTIWTTNVPRLDEGLIELIEQHLQERPTCKYVVIDVYNSVKPERKSDDVQKHDHSAMNDLRELVQRHRIALTLLNHTAQKAKGRFSKGAGSNGLFGGVHTVIELERDELGDRVVLARRGRRVPDACAEFRLSELNVDWEPVFIDDVSEDPTPEQVDEEEALAIAEREAEAKRKRPHVPGIIEARMIEKLADGGEWSPKQLADATTVRYVTVRKYLRRMLQRGQVTMVYGGVYRLVAVTPVTPVTLTAEAGNDAPLADSGMAAPVTPVTPVTPSEIATPGDSVTPTVTPGHRLGAQCVGRCVHRDEMPPADAPCPVCNARLWGQTQFKGAPLYFCRKCHPSLIRLDERRQGGAQ